MSQDTKNHRVYSSMKVEHRPSKTSKMIKDNMDVKFIPSLVKLE